MSYLDLPNAIKKHFMEKSKGVTSLTVDIEYVWQVDKNAQQVHTETILNLSVSMYTDLDFLQELQTCHFNDEGYKLFDDGEYIHYGRMKNLGISPYGVGGFEVDCHFDLFATRKST